MTSPADIPELEPLEEIAAAEPAAARAAHGPAVTPVSLAGMPAPFFGMRAQRQYYRFFFAGFLMFLGCMMPWGPEWQMAGWQTLKGGFFLVIALGIMWSSWVAIAHGKFDLSSMRWLLLAALPLIAMAWHVATIFEAPAVKAYSAAYEAAWRSQGYDASYHVHDWATLWRNLSNPNTEEYVRSLGEFIRASGTGKLMLLCGSLLAEWFLILGVISGIRAGSAKKKQTEAARADAKRAKRR